MTALTKDDNVGADIARSNIVLIRKLYHFDGNNTNL